VKRIPFLPLSPEKALKTSRHFLGIGESLSKFFPGIGWHLQQAEINLEEREWLSIAFYVFLFYTILLFSGLFVIFLAAKIALPTAFGFSFVIGFGLGIVQLVYLANYPKLVSRRNIHDIDANLPAALHHLLVHVRSGVPLFNSLVSVAATNYGTLSREFQRAINEIETGKSETAALEMLARNNPSLHFRRIMWQMINSMKSGVDIGQTLKEIVNSIAAEQKVAIKKYGSELNPLALFYMMLVVIFPTLGIVFLLVLTSFVGTGLNIEFVLIGILIFLFLVQFMFVGLMKNKRPVGV